MVYWPVPWYSQTSEENVIEAALIRDYLANSMYTLICTCIYIGKLVVLNTLKCVHT